MQDEKIVGIVDESDVLLHVHANQERFKELVETAMVRDLQVLDVTAPMDALMPIFDAGKVVIVMDGVKFLGLITRIDLLNYLRRRVQ
ncbi:MAG: CBS domain-containing protein, partial [Arenimonas sp.]|nr:CBS domain-containing protein [Arenimonas sp.]